MIMEKTKIPGFFALAIASTLAGSASAATNLLINGSFEDAGTTGTGSFTAWTKTNVSTVEPATVIGYNSTASYPDGAYGESVIPDNSASLSPDPAGSYAAYFVSDFSVNETISQSAFFTPGNYRVGFSYYLPANGLGNTNNATIDISILGTTVASTAITASSPGTTWFSVTGVATVTVAGFYDTSLVYNSNGYPAKDIVLDRFYAIATTDAAEVTIPAIPEPSAALIFGLTPMTLLLRRRNR
jgi:hypothetical protein